MNFKKTLHVVAFNVPHPPDYGGVIDVYYKLKAISESGIGIILHTFTYGRQQSKELEDLCTEVHYYNRKSGLKYFFNPLPYIVSTRISNDLLNNLLKDNLPVLYEGLHSTLTLPEVKRAGKLVMVRTHNIEHRYYQMLLKSERSIFRKIYLKSEATKLRKYETILKAADYIFSISTTDAAYFKEKYGKSIFLPAFHHYNSTEIMPGRGDYILFHGNLSVPENESAILYLIRTVISKIHFRVVIAGKDPGEGLRKVCKKYPHIELLPNVTDERMSSLIREAHVNLLYTFQPTGLKLKLLHSLYAGRFCITNLLMLSGSGLDELCEIYTSPLQAIELINSLMEKDFPVELIKQRSVALQQFDNRSNAEIIISVL